ncbi:RNA polymerase sigma-70 factor [Cohnella candidum]|uniref:RNA polymerase sigma-70 factor n=1 Tax=Cohnella candidum TaxID=2674991 RepID=A0A3G3K3N7_9BACL|nr:RNA polymerase sigma-70 factor [Cohnella candidum]AYQ75062.1 RNA polymerase sigma-70 factor [Cohnella candidum]
MMPDRQYGGNASNVAEWYAAHRRYLHTVAYRMLGTYADAEDVVQDVFAHLQVRDNGSIRDERPYLTKMVVRRSLDVLKSARRRRESYVGPWLPEPEVRPADEEPVSAMLLEETVSYALLVVLEVLTPAERAVFLLHEAFGYGYEETAEALGKTEAACRQLMSRVRRKLDREIPEPVSTEKGQELVFRFMQAAASGKMESLMELLREDIVVMTDGGGRVSAAVRPLVGAERAAAFVLGLISKYGNSDTEALPVRVNGDWGIAFREAGEWTTIVAFEWRDEAMKRMYLIRNPDKLQSIRL